MSEHASASALADAVDFAYPLGDAVVVGATLGVFALMGWRPGRMWLLLGLGLTATGVADAIYSVQALGHSYHQGGVYDAVWAGGAVLVAYAAWQPHPGRLEPREVTGWAAIALPLAAQALAAAIQVYGFFHEIPKAERVLTLIVLLIAMVQIVVTPAPATETAGRSGADVGAGFEPIRRLQAELVLQQALGGAQASLDPSLAVRPRLTADMQAEARKRTSHPRDHLP